MQVVVDSLLTSYEVMGEGKLIVLLHGWADRAAGLRSLQVALAKDFRVVALDLPGFGGTQMPPEAWGLDDYAGFAAHFLKKIDAGRVHVLLGHSNGGAIAIRGLANGLLKADRLVLMASAGVRGEQKGKLTALKAVTKVGKVLTTPLPANAKRKLRGKVYEAAGSDMLVVEEMQETLKRIVVDDVRADAAKLTLPTLLLYGEDDNATPVSFGKLFHELIKGSTLKVFPNAGHFVHLDEAENVAQTVAEFAR
ncbi:MAG TPA: alpha/beta hydrolase [Candidatus Saccharimonadales bacterium]